MRLARKFRPSVLPEPRGDAGTAGHTGSSAAAERHARCPEAPVLLASWHDQLAASVERLLLVNDMRSHGLTPARFRLGCPPRIARLLRIPERHADDLLLIFRPVRVGAQHAVRMCVRPPGPLELCQRARLDPARGHPDEVFLHGGLLQDRRVAADARGGGDLLPIISFRASWAGAGKGRSSMFVSGHHKPRTGEKGAGRSDRRDCAADFPAAHHQEAPAYAAGTRSPGLDGSGRAGMTAPQRGRTGSCGTWSCGGTPTTRV